MPETVRMDPGGVLTPEGELDDEATLARPSVSGTRARAQRCPACDQVFSGEARFCPFDGDALVDAPDWNPTADPLIGKIVDTRYEVVGVIGEGGMGTVYEVRHATLGRKFALKVLRRDLADPELTQRFIQEAKAAAAIGHPNIVAVNDFGAIPVDGGGEVPFFVMEHLEGAALAEVLRADKTIPAKRAASIVQDAASGLAAAHAAGVIHRDLKPDNVFLTRVGEREFVKLLDFGVAKIAGVGRLTRAGTVFGTPHYMSPEQAAGHAVDHRADVYALGVILYECLSGHVPFEADSYMGVLTKHMFATPEPIEQVVHDAGQLGGLGPIVMRCLAKDPVDRYATMQELADALELFLRDPRGAAAASLGSGDRISDLKLREPEAFEGRVSLPTPPVARVWPTALVVLALVGAAGGLAVWRLLAAPTEAPVTMGPQAAPNPGPSRALLASASAAPTAPPVAAVPPATAATATATAEPAPAASTPEAAALPVEPSAGPRPQASVRRPGVAPRPRAAGDVVDPWAK